MQRLTSRLTGTYVKSLEAPLPFTDIDFFPELPIKGLTVGLLDNHLEVYVLPALLVMYGVEPQDRILAPLPQGSQMFLTPVLGISASLSFVCRHHLFCLPLLLAGDAEYRVCDSLPPTGSSPVPHAGKTVVTFTFSSSPRDWFPK